MELCKDFKTMCLNENKEKITDNIDLDFQENIPQYLDDIEKIIRCSSKGIVTNYELGEGKVTIHGKIMISLTYQNCDGIILSNIFEEEFSKPIATSCQSEITAAKICLNNKYCNFRLVNQRRIDVHVALGAVIWAYCKNANSYMSECENAFLRKRQMETLDCKQTGITVLDFDETFTVPDSDSQIKNIVNSFGVCYVEDKKIIKDKMLVKMKIELSVLYTNNDNVIEKAYHSFPLSKIIDVDDCDEDDNALITAQISNIYVKSKANSNNALCDIEAVGNVAVNYQIIETAQIDLVTDCYMSGYNTTSKLEKVTVKSSPVYYYNDRSDEVIFDCDKSIVEVIDLKASITNTEIEDSKLKVSVKLSFLYYDDESTIRFYENTQSIDFALSDSPMDGEGVANLLSYDFVIKGTDKIALRISYIYSAYLYRQENVNYITDLEVNDEISNLNLPQLTLYFADANEDVWDIAKKFSTDMNLIIAENNLTSQIIQNKTVLIVPGM